MTLVDRVVPCDDCKGAGGGTHNGTPVDCETCSGTGEVTKREFVVFVSQQAVDNTNEWLRNIIEKNK